MAAPLTAEGRFPAIQTVTKSEYENFIKVCAQPPEPPQKLMALMASLKQAKKIGSRE
jgi:uncharacterized protein (DUF1778 family)